MGDNERYAGLDPEEAEILMALKSGKLDEYMAEREGGEHTLQPTVFDKRIAQKTAEIEVLKTQAAQESQNVEYEQAMDDAFAQAEAQFGRLSRYQRRKIILDVRARFGRDQ